ncbi:MAG: lamin tail domain-containing protein [Flavisolibacter sp.]
MLRRMILLCEVSLFFFTSRAQLKENFQDGDFISSPLWTGNTNDWIVNASGQLQSASIVPNNTFYLSTTNSAAIQTEWNFLVRMAFNPSGANYVDVYLGASAGNLLSTTLTGYFIRIGNTQDEVSLYRKDINGITKLIDGADGILNTSDNTLRIRVIRNAAFTFILQRDAGNTGNFVTEGSFSDSTYQSSEFFGILVRQSTTSFFQKHFFDDIDIHPYQPDINPPSILSVTALSASVLDIHFSEPVDAVQASQISNYMVSDGVGHPISAQRDTANHSIAHLEFAGSFQNGFQHTITIHGISDEWGNIMQTSESVFSFYAAKQYDIVIDEIMADPSPPVGLPEAEYLELKNTCQHPINLSSWKIRVNASVVALTEQILQPDSFLILTSLSNAPLFQLPGRVIGISSFPSLDNDGAQVTLISKEGTVIHTVKYSSSWYANSIKQNGGWSLEMADAKQPCAGQPNWKVSINPSGGTPGSINSVNGTFSDHESPRLVRTFCSDSLTVVAYFNEIPDSISAVASHNYKLEPYAGNILPDYNMSSDAVILHLDVPLQKGITYHLSVNKVKDCTGNEIGSFNNAPVGLVETSGRFDIIINEILFHPKAGEYDYVEFFNRSHKIVDAGKLFISNRTSAGLLTPKKMSDLPFAFFPGDYIVLTEDSYSLQRSYFTKYPEKVMTITSMPSFPNDKGVVVVLNSNGDVLDELEYDEKWHFPLVSNPEGVSLERINIQDTSSGKNNWHSASSSAGFGTPTYKNSQSSDISSTSGRFDVLPKVFSPDNDGRDDFVALHYQMNERGYVANILIFDARGNQVRYFQKNALLGMSGLFMWDGLGESGKKLPSGYYIFMVELFNLQGKKMHWKFPVVLAR